MNVEDVFSLSIYLGYVYKADKILLTFKVPLARRPASLSKLIVSLTLDLCVYIFLNFNFIVFFIIIIIFLCDRVSPCSSNWPCTHYIADWRWPRDDPHASAPPSAGIVGVHMTLS